MSSCTMTLLGMQHYDNTLFDGLSVPTGIDKDVLISNILLESAEFEVLYSNPSIIKEAIIMWSVKWNKTFTKWIDALAIEYEPLNNYDRTETYTDNNTSVRTGTENEINSNNNSTTSSNTNVTDSTNSGTTSNTNTDSNTSTNQISAYDSDTLVDDTKLTNSGTTTNSGTNSLNVDSTVTDNGTSSITENGTKNITTSNNDTDTSNRTGHIVGNIGVTTSQQMLKSELDIAEWNIYEKITDLFLTEFCIMVY